MKYDWEFSERIQCSEAEKRECMALVARVVTMANKAKRNGLLSLVQEAEETSHFLLRKGLQLILEGVNPQMVETTLQQYVLSSNFSGKELLQRCIIAEGVLAIQNGVNPTIIKELLLSLFGEDSYKTYQHEYGDEKIDRLKAFLKKNQKNQSHFTLKLQTGAYHPST